ncbi:phosphoenolpyruvate-utilizing enzyme [Streptomyces sp. SID13666]|uniref:PEP/pyruvate-binding domain-containing protein n=1 Tax=unclassified Streptomyces TaxID=2593676 RepID=UPI001285F5B0|nr:MULTISPECIES: PEP/pyruvate-binding domain-containing protein [unclassified Streptomyces]NEA57182.1 phosphoenolpyruvate-utilizing enzyme [Streptomyces sp. SID13666]NEA74276.1 phosphoenolpyruvate-utilizing enzyme [Streptomyces sp. SID13588]QNA71964.1 phosphoenolpyruvate-utilizing enzyme [Streptomyces sp. So13.3]
MKTPTVNQTAEDPRITDIVVLGSQDKADDGLLGGKAARLDEMIRAGLPVPAAFCITTDLFGDFLRESGLDTLAATSGSTEIRDRILAGPVPEAIARPILDAYEHLGRPRVAVRSSAVKEDSASQSFAGQHDTILDIAGDEALLDAVKVCWASLWSERATAYRTDPAEVGAIAVVVQRMIHADGGGVLFTTDPTSDAPHRMVVEACWGLGEGLVAGRVTSDFFVVDDRSLEVIEERVRYKVTKCAAVEPGKVGITKVDAAARNAPCLTREQLADLAGLAVQVREHYGAEQDIEWALHDGQLHLLQTRPITTTPVAAPRTSPYLTPQSDAVTQGTLWSRMDIGEIFNGVMSPLGQTFAQYYQRTVHGDCAAAVGVRDTGDVGLQMGYLQGHIYLNISYTSYMLGQCLPTRDQRHFTSRFVSEEVSLDGYENPFGRFPGGMEDLRSLAYWVKHTGAEMARMKKRSKQMVASRLYEFDRARGISLERLSRRELNAELSRYLGYFHDMHVGYMPYYINAFGFYGILTELCAKWLGDEGANLQNRVKTDMSSLRTVESAREIWAVAQAAKERPGVLRIIRDSDLGDIRENLLADENGRSFWNTYMEAFLRNNGTRGRQEMELTHPRWIDDPSYVFQMIRRYADDGLSVDEILERSRGYTEGDSTTVLRRLPTAKRKVIEKVISLFVMCSELREITRMSMVTSIWLVRNVVYEVGRRLVAEGVLRTLDEVAYLDFDDILRYLGGDEDARSVFSRTALDEARRVFQNYNRLPEPPLTVIGEYDVTQAIAPAADGARLEGLGASPGRVIGRARIIEDLVWQADEFQVGEILVTRFTDASWTPLFAIAGGVVTDIGSMLSHSSIVSREFNVPSVVNTKHATRRIATGDMVMVDGSTGVVEVVEG